MIDYRAATAKYDSGKLLMVFAGVLRFACFAVIALRLGGIIARYYRDQHLLHMIDSALAVLDRKSIPTFLDWSTLLGVWREGGILEDEVLCTPNCTGLCVE